MDGIAFQLDRYPIVILQPILSEHVKFIFVHMPPAIQPIHLLWRCRKDAAAEPQPVHLEEDGQARVTSD